MTTRIVLAAGGTGGHLFPAKALSVELIRRGYEVVVMTDRRGVAFADSFAGARVVVIPSAALFGRAPWKVAAALVKLAAGFFISLAKLRAMKPAAVIGFGGYPSVPIVLAASWLRLPSAVVSPDALLGRANRFLMNKVSRIAANFPLKRFLPKDMAKVIYTGNPLRPEVIAAAGAPYDMPVPGEEFRLTVFGGSQGARFFSETVPPAIAQLPETVRSRLRLVQQCRPEDLDRVRDAYEAMGVKAELKPFFGDMPKRMAASHLLITRAGAGTVSELAAIGRPAILVPLPYALDDNQSPNAEALEAAGGGWKMPQKQLSARRLSEMLSAAISDPEGLAKRAEAARSLGKLDASERLADLVQSLEAGSL